MIVSRILDVCDADAFVSSFNHNEKICIAADCEPQCTEAPWISVVVCRPLVNKSWVVFGVGSRWEMERWRDGAAERDG